MVIQASVIQIDSADNSLYIIGYKCLGMDKAGSVEINLNAGFDERIKVGLCQTVDSLFAKILSCNKKLPDLLLFITAAECAIVFNITNSS